MATIDNDDESEDRERDILRPFDDYASKISNIYSKSDSEESDAPFFTYGHSQRPE